MAKSLNIYRTFPAPGWGCLTISSVPRVEFSDRFDSTLVKFPPSPGGGGGGGTLGHAIDRCIRRKRTKWGGERERERERERETEVMSPLSGWNGRWVYTSLAKNSHFIVSPFSNGHHCGAEIHSISSHSPLPKVTPTLSLLPLLVPILSTSHGDRRTEDKWSNVCLPRHWEVKYPYYDSVRFQSPYQLFHRTFTINLTASIVLCQSCVVYTTFVGNSGLSFTTSDLNWGARRDRDTNDIFAHCSLISYFLDFKFSNFICLSELHPLIWFFFKNSFRKKKYIRKTTQNALAPSIFIVLSIALKLGTPLLYTQAQNTLLQNFQFRSRSWDMNKNLQKRCFTPPGWLWWSITFFAGRN